MKKAWFEGKVYQVVTIDEVLGMVTLCSVYGNEIHVPLDQLRRDGFFFS